MKCRYLRNNILNFLQKQSLSENDVKEIGDRNELLLREMERFDRLTRSIQKLIGVEVSSHIKKPVEKTFQCIDYIPGTVYGENKV